MKSKVRVAYVDERQRLLLMRILLGMLLLISLALVSACQWSEDDDDDDVPDREPPAANALRNPYFGDLHVHTTRSLDAGLQGMLRTPDEAYEYALGGELTLNNMPVTLEVPLDFAAVTDHAEYFGNFSLCNEETIGGETNPIYDMSADEIGPVNCPGMRADPGTPENNQTFAATFALSWLPDSGVLKGHNAEYCFNSELQVLLGLDPGDGDEVNDGDDACYDQSINFWEEMQQAANAANDPGFFTAFNAYEWTGGPLSANLHRNVIFRSEDVIDLPVGYFEATTRGEIWDQLEAGGCKPDEGDCQVLIIPHNSNLSQGRMFETTMPVGIGDPVPMDADYAAKLGDYERLVEIIQHKGQSECITTAKLIEAQLDPPELVARASSDEACDYEIVNWATLAGEGFNGTPKPQDFVRDALKVGLTLIDDVGLNPYKYGIIGSTDTHQAAPGWSMRKCILAMVVVERCLKMMAVVTLTPKTLRSPDTMSPKA